MAIPTIYRGDDADFGGASALTVSVATDFDLDGCKAAFSLCGVTREIDSLSGRTAVLALSFSAAETAAMPVGVHCGMLRIFDAQGRVRTASDSIRVKVTDILAEAYSGADAQEVDVMVELGDAKSLLKGETLKTNTPNAMRQTLKRIAQALGASVSMIALCVSAATVHTVPLGELDLDDHPSVVTNIDLSGLATESYVQQQITSAGSVTAETVTNIVLDVAPAPGDYATVSNRAMSAVQAGDVPAIVTKEAPSAYTWGDWTCEPATYNGQTFSVSFNDGEYVPMLNGIQCATAVAEEYVTDRIVWSGWDWYTEDHPESMVATRSRNVPVATTNVLGLAKNADLDALRQTLIAVSDVASSAVQPENLSTGTVYQAEYANLAISAGEANIAAEAAALWDGNTRRYAEDIYAQMDGNTAAITAVSNESQIVYRLYSSSNVVDEITNYNSVAHIPTRRMYSLTTNGYERIWDEQTMHDETRRIAETNAAAQVAAEARRADAAYAPKAWSGVTSGMGAPAPEGVTWISTPQTVIAGGYEYAKYITSAGAVWILTANGAVDLSNTTNGYFRIADADGTEMISVERMAAYVVGVNASGITVTQDGGYNVATVPIAVNIQPTAYYCTNLVNAVWFTNNTDVATIEWTQTAGGYECTATSASPQLFMRFEVMQEGSTVIRNKAPISVDGGILCTDGIHKVRPVYSNGAVTWEVVQ